MYLQYVHHISTIGRKFRILLDANVVIYPATYDGRDYAKCSVDVNDNNTAFGGAQVVLP